MKNKKQKTTQSIWGTTYQYLDNIYNIDIDKNYDDFVDKMTEIKI